MSFCEHCAGQRFDRAQVLRTLRDTRRRFRDEAEPCSAEEALDAAIRAVRELEIPHLEPLDEMGDDTVIH
jgi:hypothetical protein